MAFENINLGSLCRKILFLQQNRHADVGIIPKKTISHGAKGCA